MTSESGELLIFKEIASWNKSLHFENHTTIEFQGRMKPVGLYFQFEGNVSSEQESDFGIVSLRPKGNLTLCFFVNKH